MNYKKDLNSYSMYSGLSHILRNRWRCILRTTTGLVLLRLKRTCEEWILALSFCICSHLIVQYSSNVWSGFQHSINSTF
ncbi:unnamed protein product [Haemonchus placei]|uniref:Ovule protein n=1 Tax=Haemonchus placei TaxID=6290 RepID=A0A0N4WUS9_HAEPC|nr:unnamed protein product [Haemonchus placei]